MDIGWKRLIHPTTGALAAFAFHFLLFQLTESLVNDRAAELLGAEAVNPVYAAGLFCTASGYLLFAVLSRRIGSVTLRRRILASMGAGYLLSALWMATTMQPLGFVVCALAGLLSAGYIGGMSHWVLASALRDGKYTGRAASAAIAAGIGIQYLVQNFLPTPAAWLVWLAAAVFTVVFQYRCPDGGSFSGGPPSRCGTEPRLRRRLFVLSAAVVLMSLIISLDDTVCLTLHAQGSVNLFALPRVFYAGSVLLAGCLADRKDRAYLPLATVCVLLISGFTFAFLNRPDTYWVNVCLLYTYSGFYVAFFTIMFLDAAPKSSCPELWAGMGRIARSYTLAIATVPFIHLFDAFGSLPMMVLSTFFRPGACCSFLSSGCSALCGQKKRPRPMPGLWRSLPKSIICPPARPRYWPPSWITTGASGSWRRNCIFPNAPLTVISPASMKKPAPAPGWGFPSFTMASTKMRTSAGRPGRKGRLNEPDRAVRPFLCTKSLLSLQKGRQAEIKTA